ncbi:hypothetical protein [Corynebacterium glutamicum]|uniref:hypothetical protein n=1 Tax=Corynebacterium glutamicum TaxID=1718 RepID=UPI00117CE55C|nr:hypothetical protein [Corynebacterium glutamicum]QDQ21085.1 hypothetical protein FOL53_10225 [Corynebacterium glutamicum]QDQ22123.1 hypothetical protein FOY32_00195 [Corynebacterium glutamicum]
MKLFSRTALVALGTATAMAATSISAPAQAADVAPAQVVYLAEEEPGSSNISSDIDIDEITDYILIITGIIGILSAGLTFATTFERAMK